MFMTSRGWAPRALGIFGISALTLSAFTTTTLDDAVAGGSHAKPSYPPQSALGNVINRNVRGFGRLFQLKSSKTTTNDEALHPHPSGRHDLLKLGRAMIDAPGTVGARGQMPAGYVFLGQFIDHDLTLDTVSGFDNLIGESKFENARTADLDLDCVYGGGPERTPYLYEDGGPYLRVGAVVVDGARELSATDLANRARHDLFRIKPAATPDFIGPTALIGDPRNDENTVVSQLQAAFVAYHNRIVDRLIIVDLNKFKARLAKFGTETTVGTVRLSQQAANQAFSGPSAKSVAPVLSRARRSDDGTIEVDLSSLTPKRYFEEVVKGSPSERAHLLERARDIVIHVYHRMILEDFLPRIIGINRTLDILENGRDFYFKNGFADAEVRTVEPFIPIEFAVAGYRFGHSQVPATFNIRRNAGRLHVFPNDNMASGDLSRRGFTRVRVAGTSSVIDWRYLVDISGAIKPDRALSIDPRLSNPLGALNKVNVVGPGDEGNLASRNLSRGRTYRLPSGQDLACLVLKKMHARGALEANYSNSSGSPDAGFRCNKGARSATPWDRFVLPADRTTASILAVRETPLWYYILQEAERFGGPFDVFAMSAASNGAAKPRTLSAKEREDRLIVGATKLLPPGATPGSTLGPVGSAIVGETLVGLIDHYRESTGRGYDLNPELGTYILNGAGKAVDRRGQAAARGHLLLTETRVVLDGIDFGERYLLRNFLHDAGVAGAVDERDVCRKDGSDEADACNNN